MAKQQLLYLRNHDLVEKQRVTPTLLVPLVGLDEGCHCNQAGTAFYV